MTSTIGEKWAALNDAAYEAFARDWLKEVRNGAEPTEDDLGSEVVLMNFTAPPDKQWLFVTFAVAAAESDDELWSIAAGPLEHILGCYGEDYIDLVEQISATDPKFAWTLTGVWQHGMSDGLWARVQQIQAAAEEQPWSWPEG